MDTVSRTLERNWRLVGSPLRMFWAYWLSQEKFCYAVVALGVCLALERSHSAPPPSALFSPDKTFSIKIVTTSLPSSDSYEGFYTIVVLRKGHVLSQFPTEGYLVNALWSPNGRYAAVNNRRGSSGDYLWVFRLTDGKAIKVPNDEAAERIVREVSLRLPEFTMDTFNRRYTMARRWNNRNELEVRTELQFFNLDDAVVRVDQLDRVDGESLISVSQTIQKVPQ